MDEEQALMKILDDYYGNSRDEAFKDEIVGFLLAMGYEIVTILTGEDK